MTVKIDIRHAEKSDLAEIKYVYTRSILENCCNDYDAKQLNTWISSIEKTDRWHQIIEEHYFIVAIKDNDIVGFASIFNKNYLDLIYVHPEYIRKGVGKALFAELEKFAQAYQTRKLSADVSKTALPFFLSNGFNMVEENKNIIQGVEIINYHMEKIL